MDADPKKLMEEGWQARESLEFEKAEKLLTEAKILFEEAGDWFNVTEALNHLAYNEKLRAGQNNLKGITYAEEAKAVADKYNTKAELVFRALMSLASSAGFFEQALKWGEMCLDSVTTAAAKADILSHIAVFQLRTGKLKEAERTITKASTCMEDGFSLEREPHRSIWKSKILIAKALIFYNKGDFESVKKILVEARLVAEKQNLKARLAEIAEVSKLL